MRNRNEQDITYTRLALLRRQKKGEGGDDEQQNKYGTSKMKKHNKEKKQ